jgi:general secretion pathway protein J
MRARQAGYTLLELLVALLVFGLVMAGIAQTMRYGLAAFTASGSRGIAPENLAALDMGLTRMVAGALPDSLRGEPGGMSFTTTLPRGADIGDGLADAAIQMARGGVLMLIYRQHPPGVLLVPAPPPHTEMLARGVTAFALSYYGAQQAGQSPAWSARWAGTGLPLLVRLHLRIGKDARPDLVIAPESQGG